MATTSATSGKSLGRLDPQAFGFMPDGKRCGFFRVEMFASREPESTSLENSVSLMKAMSAPPLKGDVKMHCAGVADGFVSLSVGLATCGLV
jgi:hypothetical protein